MKRAVENATHNGLQHKVSYEMANLFEVTEASFAALGKFDKMLVDPPRDGAMQLLKAITEDTAPGADLRPTQRVVPVALSPAPRPSLRPGDTFFYGRSTVLRLQRLDGARQPLAGPCVLLLPAAIFMGQADIRPTAMAWGNLAFQAVIVSFASFLLWFWLLKKYLASQLGVFSFLTPLFGVAFGVWLLGEPLEPRFVAGAGLVLLGIVGVSGHTWLAQVLLRRKAAQHVKLTP